MSCSSETVKSQIFASNDITKTNPFCLNLSKRKFAKRVNKKHTSYTTNIGGIIKNHPHKFLVDNYIMKKIQIQKILFLIGSLKKEERIRNQLTEKINELSSFENKASKNITTTVILKELQKRLTEGHNNHQQAIEYLSEKLFELGGLKDIVERQKQQIFRNLNEKVNYKVGFCCLPESQKELTKRQKMLVENKRKLAKKTLILKGITDLIKDNQLVLNRLNATVESIKPEGQKVKRVI